MIKLTSKDLLMKYFFIFILTCISLIAKEKPNIVLILSDDQGWGDLSIQGNTNVKTPNIDSIGTNGKNFKYFYVSAKCSPTRASMFTGRYHPRCGVTGTSKGEERVDLDEKLLSEILKENGYVTGGFGKWHSGQQYPYHPNARGFDEWYGFCCGHWSNYFDTKLEHNGKEIESEGFLADDLTNKAIDFIEKNSKVPFFCYIPYNTPHSPMQVPDKYFDAVKARGIHLLSEKGKDENLDFTTAALAMCENIDWNVGRVLAKLNELNLTKNTIVIYMSDNGPNSYRWNGGLKGIKGDNDEGGLRVPFLIQWPDKISKGDVSSAATHIDLLPTLCDLLNIEAKLPKKIDGISLKNLLLNNTPLEERNIFSFFDNKISMRNSRFRADYNGLYDLTVDPGQKKNLKDELPAEFNKMVQLLKSMEAEMRLESNGLRPFTVGHPKISITPLPIRDCLLSGAKISRSNKHPNDTHLINWSDINEFPYWEIELLSSGKYEILIDYTCSKENKGCEIEFQFNGASLIGTISEAYEPEIIPSPDRTKRIESYDKPFKRISLGEVELKMGAGKASLKCLKMPGNGIIDIKAIYIKKNN